MGRTGAKILLPPLIVLVGFAGILPLPDTSAATSRAAARAPRQEINDDGYTSARVCGECHRDIYESWKNSLHAFSLTDPIFDTAYMLAVKEAGQEARVFCLRCHAPMTTYNGDYLLELGVTREGVSCDFCHTITAVHLDRPDNPYSIDPGPVKRSVIRNADSPAHEVAYSELHGTSEFCGGCHNYVAPGGSGIMTTYDEWKRGPYATEGTQCQDCHMVLSPGRVVEERIKSSATQIHLHRLIHDTDQLRSALTVEITESRRTADSFVVEVKVENVGSGHAVPTGMPSREVVLSVPAAGPRRDQSAERRFRKVVAADSGRPLQRDHEALLYGARVLNDTRARPPAVIGHQKLSARRDVARRLVSLEREAFR